MTAELTGASNWHAGCARKPRDRCVRCSDLLGGHGTMDTRDVTFDPCWMVDLTASDMSPAPANILAGDR